MPSRFRNAVSLAANGSLGSRVRVLVSSLPRWAVVLAGLRYLELYAFHAFGGREKIWRFGHMNQHRLTAMSMLTGTLRLKNGVSRAGHDEQVFNGATYTNWGFGVPLLQAPFHAVAARVHWFSNKFFPDRAIYFGYFALTVPVLWAAFDRLIALRARPGTPKLQRHIVSWAATACVVTTALLPLMSCRFLIYEETVCYLVIAELLALSAYIFALPPGSRAAPYALGVAAGMGLLIRPTGLVYLGMWTMILVLESEPQHGVVFDRRNPSTWFAVLRSSKLAWFASAVVPFLIFWGYSNWIRSGSFYGIGFNNALPGYDFHTPMLRFGSVCNDTREHTWQTAWQLFQGFFFTTGSDPKPWLKTCHFDFETRPAISAEADPHGPFFGPAVLAGLVWMLGHLLARRERRLALYVPWATLALLFGSYVWAGGGFAWRYAGDFWPAIVVGAVGYVRSLPPSVRWTSSAALATVFLVASFHTYTREIEPTEPTLELLDATLEPRMWDEFSDDRWGGDKPLATSTVCSEYRTWPFRNGQGWRSDCSVDSFTNVYLGIPWKATTEYDIQFKTEGMAAASARVYVNGRVYTARNEAGTFVARVRIPRARFASPIVMATIEWSSGVELPPHGRLLSVELV
jgi:hypothetical protein